MTEATAATTTTKAKSRMAAKAEEAIAANAYDIEAWQTLVEEAQAEGIDSFRDAMDRFLKVFPTSSRHWRQLIDAEVAAGARDRVEALFRRCLLQVPSVEIWRAYVDFVKSGGQPHDEVTRAYEFALQHIGIDIVSGSLWTDFIAHLKGLKKQTNKQETN